MRSLSTRLIVAFLVISIVGTLLVAVYVALTTTNRFGEFVIDQYVEQLATRLTEYYRSQGSWEGVAEAVSISRPVVDSDWHVGAQSPYQPDQGQSVQVPPPGPRPSAIALVDNTGKTVLTEAGHSLDHQFSQQEINAGVAIVVNGARVGTLITARPPRNTSASNGFLTGFYNMLAIGAAAATVIALGLGVVLTRSITRPVRELTAATNALAQGDLGHSIPVRSHDELGKLAQSFNQMSSRLAQGEELRRQMTADIAHELRTPLSLILGHAEALSDGVLPPTQETFNIIYDEAARLARLVEDLRTLSIFDAGKPELQIEPVPPAEFLQGVAVAFRPQALTHHVELEILADPALPPVEIDPERMAQVFRNLISNALRYTPDGGRITLAAQQQGSNMELSVQDNGAGMPPEVLPLVFERFYRADTSRQKQSGETGLGLAIARAFVEAHGGKIRAESAGPGQGSTFTVTLPLTSAQGEAAS